MYLDYTNRSILRFLPHNGKLQVKMKFDVEKVDFSTPYFTIVGAGTEYGIQNYKFYEIWKCEGPIEVSIVWLSRNFKGLWVILYYFLICSV